MRGKRAVPPSIGVVDHYGGGFGIGLQDMAWRGWAAVAQRLTGRVVEAQAAARHTGQLGQDVALGDGHLAVLHFLGMVEVDLTQQADLLQQHATDQAVPVAAGDQALGACRALGRACAGASFGASLGVGEAWDDPPQRANNDGWHRKSPRPFGLKLAMG